MPSEDHRLEHARVGSWFLGPRAENFETLKKFFARILDDQRDARKKIYEQDPDFITADMMKADGFTSSIAKLEKDVNELSKALANHSIPFWSPRYNAHMNMDTAMPSIIGYMASMMYNPNNVATEASPFTTALERDVGMQLCHMLGYRFPEDSPGWGHITCDGSVANLEAIWATRNLKFYPLSLKLAMGDQGPLRFLADAEPPFLVENCQGTKKPFIELSTWELLNLKPSTILDLPTRLATEYSISPVFLQTALKDFLIQTIGKDELEKRFGIKKSPKFLISTTKHYSWPKGGAIAGLGSACFIDIEVDDDARMDMADLRRHLEACIAPKNEDERTPVFGGVAIIGSTEHGACDPIADLVDMRKEYEQKGLSFAIHADAAWGGYFASMLPIIRADPHALPYVPTLALKPYTIRQLRALANADSITIDPHKSGYINYPAGGLCYRDARMRYLITWTSPIVYHAGDDTESMGVYGVEGSKPGASAVATWLTHKTLGLHYKGYGRLLGEAVFTCTKLYCYWATMTTPDSDLIVVPLIRLPAEQEGGDQRKIEEQKDYIRQKILGVSNEELTNDKEASELLKKLGGDLMINAFACNFKIDGKPNRNVVEANCLNERIFKRLSVTSMADDVKKRPLFLTQSSFGEKEYGSCLQHYKRRLQLDDGSGQGAHGDLKFLVNVTMSPWPTDSPFLGDIAKSFRQIAEEEVKRCVLRNTITESMHGFVMQGLEHVFLVHLPMFNMANHRWQLVLAADLPAAARDQYHKLRRENPSKFYTVANTAPEILEAILKPGASVHVRMDEGIPAPDAPPLAEFELTNIRVVVQESMAFDNIDATYPDKMPFYLYGSAGERHVDHVLKTSPNAQLNSDCVSVAVQPELTEEQLTKGVVVVFETVFEKTMQPLPTNSSGQIDMAQIPGLSFEPGAKHKVSVYNSLADSRNGMAQPVARGEITLGTTVYADWKEVNMDPASEDHEE